MELSTFREENSYINFGAPNDMNMSRGNPQSDAGCVRIAGYRRLSYVIILIPIVSIIALGIYILAHEAISGFPDRRPVMLFYDLGFAIFLPLTVRPIFWMIKVPLFVRPPVLFIEDGVLIYGRKKAFCAPINDTNVMLSTDGTLFRKLILSSKEGKRLSVPLYVLDKSGPEIIDEVNARRC